MSKKSTSQDTVRVRIVHARNSAKHLVVDLPQSMTAQQVLESLQQPQGETPAFLPAPSANNTYVLVLEETQLASGQTMQAAGVKNDDTLFVDLDGISA